MPRFIYVAFRDSKAAACLLLYPEERNSRLFSKHWLLSARLYSVTSQKTVILSSMRTSQVLVSDHEVHGRGVKLHEFCLSVIVAEL
jgi:hypothetical protein